MDPIDELPGLSEVKMDTIDELPESSEVKMDTIDELPESSEVKMHTIDELPESSEEKVNTADELPNSSSLHDDRNDAELPPDYYDFPVKRMVYGDLTFHVLNGIVRIKGNNVCLRIIFAKPPRGIKPDRRHCLQIQLSFSHIHKFMFLAPENNNGATAIILAVSDVAVLRINGALSAATGDKVTGHPSRRYIFFDLLFNRNNPADSFRWDEILKYISHEYNMLIHKRLSEAKMVLSDKDYVELEKNLKAGNIAFIRKESMVELLKFSDIQMEVVQDNGFDYIVFTPTNELQTAAGEKRNEPAQIVISDISVPKLDKNDIIQQESASGRIEFNFNDMALLSPNAWLNDKIVDCYCYLLFKSLPEEKRPRIRLCETYFYTSITKGIENETNPTRLKAGIYQNYDPKKFKQSFFDSDFIVVPIHRLNHWFLVVIVDPKAAISQADPPTTSDPSTTAEEVSHCHFLIFDSFKKLALNEHDISFDHLTYFLARHYDDVKSNLASPEIFNRGLVTKVFPKDMPQQTNADDCGVYSLMFLKYFFDHLPDGTSLPDFSAWWKTFTIQGMRDKIYAEIVTTAKNYEDIKRRHDLLKEQQQQPPAKKPKIQTHTTQQIYRISVPTFRPSGATPITFRPRAPTSTRLPTAVPPRAINTARRGRGAPSGPRKPNPTKRGPRKSAAEKAAPNAPALDTEVTAQPPPAAESESKESSANESINNARLESMGLQPSDDESGS